MVERERLTIIILASLVLGLMVLVVVLTWLADTQTVDALQDFVNYLDDHTDNQSKLIITLGAVLLGLLALIVVTIEVLPSPVSDIRVEENGKTRTVISGASVREQLVQDLRSMPGVNGAEAEVYGRKNGMEVAVSLELGRQTNINEAADAARRLIHETAQNRLGVPLLTEPVIKVKFVPGAAPPSQVTTPDEGPEA